MNWAAHILWQEKIEDDYCQFCKKLCGTEKIIVLMFSNTKNEALFGCLAVLFIYVQKTSTCLIRPKGFFSSSFLSSVCKYRPKKWCTNIRFGFMVQDKKSKKEYVFFMLLSLSRHAAVVV